jgi:hypothetical protein
MTDIPDPLTDERGETRRVSRAAYARLEAELADTQAALALAQTDRDISKTSLAVVEDQYVLMASLVGFWLDSVRMDPDGKLGFEVSHLRAAYTITKATTEAL